MGVTVPPYKPDGGKAALKAGGGGGLGLPVVYWLNWAPAGTWGAGRQVRPSWATETSGV